MLNDLAKRNLVKTCWDVTRRLKPPGVPDRASCLYAALATAATLLEVELSVLLPRPPKVIIQAGSMAWPLGVPPEVDDGRMATHFSYVWEADVRSFAELAANVLPEMHCWVGLLYQSGRQEIVDITTGHFPDQARETAGLKWFGPRPPEFLWSETKDLPPAVRYQPDLAAIRTVDYLLKKIIRSL